MALVFNMGSQARLEQGIDDADTRILLTSYDTMLDKGGTGDRFYAQMINVEGDREIVLVDVENSDAVQGLSVTRGVEGTAATDWGAGTIIWQVMSGASMEMIAQESVARQVAFVPDGVLVSDYPGEKVYQSDTHMWWKAVGEATTVWRLIAGEIFVADVTFSPSAGAYTNGTDLTMDCITAGVSIYYTADGSTPDQTDTLYSSPFEMINDATTTYKARAFGAERYEQPSVNITSGEYILSAFSAIFGEFFEETAPTYDGYDNPGWSEFAGGETIDPDALSSAAGSPSGWGTQCLEISVASPFFGTCWVESPDFTPLTEIYIRFEIVFTSITAPTNNRRIQLFEMVDTFGALSFVTYLYRDASGVNRFELGSGGTTSDPISLDTVYRIEYHLEGSVSWEWRINGSTEDSGASGSSLLWEKIRLGAITNGSFAGGFTSYWDKVAVDDSGWIGP